MAYSTEHEIIIDTLDEIEQLQNDMDDVVNRIAKIITDTIAPNNEEFVCTVCLGVAHDLYNILQDYAREEDCNEIFKKFNKLTGRNIDD